MTTIPQHCQDEEGIPMRFCSTLTVASVALLLATTVATAQDDYIAFFSCDEGGGEYIIDQGPEGLLGTLTDVTFGEGISGTGIVFNGDSSVCSLADGDGVPDSIGELDFGTISLWFKFNEYPAAGVIHSLFYLGSDTDSSTHNSFQIEVGHIQSNTKLYYTISPPQGTEQPSLCYDSGYDLQLDTWYYFAVVNSPSGNTGYLNGQEMTGRHYNFGSPDDIDFCNEILSQEVNWLGRGRFSGGAQSLDGMLDEIRVYDRPLTSKEILTYFESFDYTPPPPPKDDDHVTIESPDFGDVIGGQIEVIGSSTGIPDGRIRIGIDGSPYEFADGTDPWSFMVDTSAYADGMHTIIARARPCPSCPMLSHEVAVTFDNIPPAVTIESPADGDVAHGLATATGELLSGGSLVRARVDEGPWITGSIDETTWMVDLDLTEITDAAHLLTIHVQDAPGQWDPGLSTFIVNDQSPPMPDCDTTNAGDRLPWPNGAAPDYVDTCGKVCYPEAHFVILGHSESLGYDDELQTLINVNPPDGRLYGVHNHAIAGHETWEWNTPGSQGFESIESILADRVYPTIALVLTTNSATYPIASPTLDDPAFVRFVDDLEAMADHLWDSGDGLVMIYFTAHRMRPDNLMPAWHENLAIAELMNRAEASGKTYIKPGPELHNLSWCNFPVSYANDLAHPNQLGDDLMAQSWHAILKEDLIRPGDVNNDGATSTSDLLMVLAAWGECPDDVPCPADCTGDGRVDVSDILVVLSWWT